MKKCNQRKRTKKSGFFAMLLALVGIGTTSCWPVCMYGTPSAEWSVKGKVIDDAGRPVPGLQVALGNRVDNEPGVIYDQNYWPLDTLTTGPDGVYQVNSSGFPLSKLQVDVKDIDGEANGGEFADAAVIISDFKFEGGDGAWYDGHADINVPDIVVKKKQ